MKSLKVICFLLIFSALSCSSKTVKVDNLDVFTNIESLSEYLADKIIENDKQKGYLKIVFFPIINEDKQFKLLGYHISNQIKTSLFKEKNMTF